MPDIYSELLEYVKTNRRLCPQPEPWNTLWNMLALCRSKGGSSPDPPLILAAWWNSPGLMKHLRFIEHLEWANTHGSIDRVDAYLRQLRENQWFHGND